MKSRTHNCGTINARELLFKQRGPAIEKTGGAHGSKLGEKGYNRQRDKRTAEKNW